MHVFLYFFVIFSIYFEYFHTYKKFKLYICLTVKIKFHKDKVNIPRLKSKYKSYKNVQAQKDIML